MTRHLPRRRRGGPSDRKMGYAVSLSRRSRLPLPRGWGRDPAICDAFIDRAKTHLGLDRAKAEDTVMDVEVELDLALLAELRERGER